MIMTETKVTNTPGPWEPVGIDDGYGSPLSVYKGSIPIASISGQATGGKAEWRANARLIASAPELLDALRGALFYVPVATKARELANAAIDKATGHD